MNKFKPGDEVCDKRDEPKKAYVGYVVGYSQFPGNVVVETSDRLFAEKEINLQLISEYKAHWTNLKEQALSKLTNEEKKALGY